MTADLLGVNYPHVGLCGSLSQVDGSRSVASGRCETIRRGGFENVGFRTPSWTFERRPRIGDSGRPTRSTRCASSSQQDAIGELMSQQTPPGPLSAATGLTARRLPIRRSMHRHGYFGRSLRDCGQGTYLIRLPALGPPPGMVTLWEED